ncbi:hypothetical protein SAMN04487770_101130 [Butyrivibrio sp. ob235]|uniref:hypothetical protein n=1 Tax=Butyrivibrio sp. ob235 TaxID=1761780 RepID=UPI0008CD1DFB|nr:hypothetical protein [Butyrivibrio sp. ob235]SEK29593.1 hypothetical protein SAMN04487770_101130 [Butyrivibrio sp. ob235]
MNETSNRYEYLTNKARLILDSGKGYRDNTLFPEISALSTDKRDPIDVVTTEIMRCGKYEVCDFIINHYSSSLSHRDYRLLANLVYEIKTTGFPIIDSIKNDQLRRVVNKLTSRFNYCLWLCASPDDIYNHYIKEYIPKADKLKPGYADSCPDFSIKSSLSLEEYKNRYVEETNIPADNIILCDLGIEGVLIAYSN